MSDLPGFTISFDAPPVSPKQVVTFHPAQDLWGALQQTPQRKGRHNTKAQDKTRKNASSRSHVRPGKQYSTIHSSHQISNSLSNLPAIQPDAACVVQKNPVQLNPLGETQLEPTEDAFLEPDIDVDMDTVPPDSELSPNTGTTPSDEAYEIFVEAVQAEECGFWQLAETLFIANGWDIRTNTSTLLWYHMTRVKTANGEEIACLCPEAKVCDGCLHIRFLQDHGRERFPPLPEKTTYNDHTILFSRYRANVPEEGEEESDKIFHNLFSVYLPGLSASAKTRVVVEHEGNNTGSGHWTCIKHPRIVNCEHILAARDCLQQRIKNDELARDTLIKRDCLIYDDTPVKHAARCESVSYRPIPPAIWAQLPSDAEPPVRKLLENPPGSFSLGSTSSCCCLPGSRAFYEPTKPVKSAECVVYGITRMWKATIETQKCPACKHRYIGPDCGEIGIFNWNNRCLFMHDLLEDYTCSYTTSETPIHSWVLTVSRRYQSHGAQFIGEKRFTAVWFAYARLLELKDDMKCPKCGPTPRVTIWDGVTLAFTRKNILSSLCPPTTIHPNAPQRSQTRYPVNPQCIQDKELRKSIAMIFSGPPLDPLVLAFPVHLEADIEGTAASSDITTALKANMSMRMRLDAITPTTQKLNDINVSLGLLFNRCFGLDGPHPYSVPPIYRQLFQQLAAEESAMQLMTRPVLRNMETFLANPGAETLPRLTMFPALYDVIRHELPTGIKSDTLGACKWMLVRGWTVLLGMLTEDESGGRDVGPADVGPWTETGCYYGLPQIRHRPFYPLLANDGQVDKGGKDSKGEGCQKHYQKYGKQTLTGGLMVVWCTHSVCYGFHHIPMAEGRNEVFSAIYTHWEKAPEVVIYDFACNLEPYCMTREADFFADTTFLIDKFHAAGHTKCGKASFVNTYVAANPSLMEVNSSAAECGNGGVHRIRKSVSYMTQENAIIYTKIYFSYWNRAQIRTMIEGQRRHGRLVRD